MSNTFSPRLSAAIRESDLPKIKFILTEEPQLIDSLAPGGSCQHYAASLGKVDVLELLFKLGGTLNLRERHDGFLPVCSAARNGQSDAVAYLISLGQPLETTPSVCNPLLGAISGGRSPECVRLLLDAGIDAGHRYEGGPRGEMTATAFAVLQGLPEIADMIAEHLSEGDAAKKAEILADSERVASAQGPMKRAPILPSVGDLNRDSLE